jgi:hypothetical protein
MRQIVKRKKKVFQDQPWLEYTGYNVLIGRWPKKYTKHDIDRTNKACHEMGIFLEDNYPGIGTYDEPLMPRGCRVLGIDPVKSAKLEKMANRKFKQLLVVKRGSVCK